MTDDRQAERRASSILERHAQTVIASAALAMLVWVASTLNSLQMASVRQEERMITLKAAMDSQGEQIMQLQRSYQDLNLRVNQLESGRKI